MLRYQSSAWEIMTSKRIDWTREQNTMECDEKNSIDREEGQAEGHGLVFSLGLGRTFSGLRVLVISIGKPRKFS